jgi:hypothetical protein
MITLLFTSPFNETTLEFSLVRPGGVLLDGDDVLRCQRHLVSHHLPFFIHLRKGYGGFARYGRQG